MHRQNLFDGECYTTHFAIITYKKLMSGQWVTYADIMAEFLGKTSVADLECSISKCDHYSALKKAFPAICDAINTAVGKDCIYEEGNKKNKKYRYIYKEENDDPLADMRNAKVITNLEQYWKFCQDSAGFFPISWLEYFFRDCQDLLDIKTKRQKGEQVISASIDRILTNIELLPMLYEVITNRQVLEITYKSFNEEKTTLTFHPHYLKEYNGRWHLFGHAEGKEPEYGYDIALDRIEGIPRPIKDFLYIPQPTATFYKDYFNDIVGVSHRKNARMEHIIIRAHSYYMYKLTETKPIHKTQEVVTQYGDYIDGSYGEFSVDLEANKEFVGRILQMGSDLEIVSPESLRNELRDEVQLLTERYK